MRKIYTVYEYKMEFPQKYLDWIEFLLDKKLYGAWIKDVSINIKWGEFRLERWQSINAPFLSSTYWNPKIEEKKIFTVNRNKFTNAFIGIFDTSDDSVKELISTLARNLKSSIIDGFLPTGVHWTQVFKEFYDRRHPKITLSRKLSKKMYRSNNKVSSGKHYYSEREEQPWYDKSYEKYNKKAWRK